MGEIEKSHDFIIVSRDIDEGLRKTIRISRVNSSRVSKSHTCMTCPNAVKIKLAGIAGGNAFKSSVYCAMAIPYHCGLYTKTYRCSIPDVLHSVDNILY
jgi:hypothetical protein